MATVLWHYGVSFFQPFRMIVRGVCRVEASSMTVALSEKRQLPLAAMENPPFVLEHPALIF